MVHNEPVSGSNIRARQLFQEIDRHLLQDTKPSEFLSQLNQTDLKQTPPFSMLAKLKETEQSPQHHPEGNVWNHTLLVVDRASLVKNLSNDPRAFMWAALLHDIGKPDTTRLRGGKITSYDHDIVGSKSADDFLRQLGENQEFRNIVTAFVRWHMQILFVVKSPSFSNIKKMKSQISVWDIALLGFCDRLGRLHPDIAQEENNVRTFLVKSGESTEKTGNFFNEIHRII